MFKLNTRKTYNIIYKEYRESESSSPHKATIVGLFKELLQQNEPHSVLDLGCGSGVFAIAAKQAGVEYVVGIDISTEQIQFAQKQSKKLGLKIEYGLEDITAFELQFVFDMAVSAFGFCYAQTEEILRDQLTSAYEHVRPGGSFFFVVCDPDHPIRELGDNYRTSLKSPKLVDGAILKCDFLAEEAVVATDYKVYWTRKTLEKVLKEIGYRNIVWREINDEATSSILYASKT